MVQFLKDLFKGYDGRLNKRNRLLHERSHLALEFPQSKDRVIRTFVPFLENPQISEKGRARLNTYDLVGRAGQLFSYGGAQSRSFSLTFNISLLHVIETDITEGITDKFRRRFRLFFTEREQATKAFNMSKTIRKSLENAGNMMGLGGNMLQQFLDTSDELAFAGVGGGTADIKVQDPRGNGRDHAAIHRDYYRQVVEKITGQPVQDDTSLDFLSNILTSEEYTTISQGYKDLDTVIDLVYCWINLIRATTLNNSSNSIYGPPIVRLTHGPMYNNVPCLVEDYSIRIAEEAGYELQTLTPKRVEITLNMIESRTGDFGEYEATAIEDGDNLTGWESIIGNNDIDPYNGLIGSQGEVGGRIK